MVFNTTFNNISVISWQSVLLVEETGGPGENHYASLNPAHGEVYSIQHFMIKFVSDLIQHFMIKFVSDLIQHFMIKFVSD
jgi:hypothetical protein